MLPVPAHERAILFARRVASFSGEALMRDSQKDEASKKVAELRVAFELALPVSTS